MSALATAIIALLNARKGKVLDLAELAFKDKHQFMIFKKLFLNEFGKSSLEPELIRVVAEFEQQRKGRE